MHYSMDEIKKKTSPIAREYGVKRMSLFGSYARGDADEDSDVDFYIERGALDGLIQYCAFVDALEDALGCHVDVVTTGIRDKAFLDEIAGEGILLYEANG